MWEVWLRVWQRINLVFVDLAIIIARSMAFEIFLFVNQFKRLCGT